MSSAPATQSLYTRFVVAELPDGAVGEVADLLAEGTLTRDSFDEVERRWAGRAPRAFRDGLLDLLLYAIREALRDHGVTADEVTMLRHLTTIFRVQEGELYAHRRAEVTELLQAEVTRLLEDGRVDAFEAAYQEELQRIFGLSYDQFLELTRDVITPIIDQLIANATADGVVTREERADIDRKLAALRTVYPLSIAQRHALGLV
jgi:hypothetical protein